ncbi:probable cytochrome P450 301a1, mitochondrial isoform X2 [Dermacentor albipictus]|uniref:probable cytochrome P450 301a1, mitochondrial isoform X2 n=1 Tax=Dermacentor albipictus TaxID=60249 RepID=UPI0031FC9968
MQHILNVRSGALRALRYAKTLVKLRHAASARNGALPFSEIPKIPAFPLVGSGWIYLPLIGRYDIRDGSGAARDMYQRYGPIVVQQLPGRRAIVRLFSANDIRMLYQEEGRTPRHVGSLALKLFHQSQKPQFFANDGLLHAQGDEWRRIRSQTHTSVSAPCVVQGYAEGIADVVDDTISLIASARDEKEEVEDCHVLMRRWALESTMLLTVDERLGVLEPNLDAHSTAANMFNIKEDLFCILNTLTTSFPYYLFFPTPMWRQFRRRGHEAIRLLLPLVRTAAERAEHMAEEERPTLAASLRRAGMQSFKEIFTFVFDFIMAGSETVAAGATYCLYCLAMNPLAQQKAREEVQSVLSKAPDSEIALKYMELSYVKACIRESLRLYPIVTGIHRKLDHDVVMSGYMIPKNTVLRTEIFVSGRLEENFTRASEFIPDRWLRGSGDRLSEHLENWTHHPFASLPFSSGVRMCIGRRIAEMEMCILVAKVLQTFRVENHYGDIGFLSQLTSHPQKPARFRFIKL